MQKDDLILFFQAPANLPYLLKQYEENVGKKNIYIYVMNVENDYRFIKSLNLKVKEILSLMILFSRDILQLLK